MVKERDKEREKLRKRDLRFFCKYLENLDVAELRQRRLFLRYFEELKVAGLDPVAAINLVFGIGTGGFLQKIVAGMELMRDRHKPPGVFFWQLQNATPRTQKLIFKLLKWEGPTGLAVEIEDIIKGKKEEAAKTQRARTAEMKRLVKERLAPALREVIAKFETGGAIPEKVEGFGGIPGKTIEAVLNSYAQKRKPGPWPLDEMAVAILIKSRRSDEDPKHALERWRAAWKEQTRPPRPPRKRRRVISRPHLP